MKSMQKQCKRLRCIFLFSIISAFSILLIPISDFFEEPSKKIISVITAALFWLSIIITLVINHSMSRDTYLYYSENKKNSDKNAKYSRCPGAFKFGKNIKSIISTAIFIMGAIILILDIIWGFLNKNMFFVIVSVSYFSFCCHCIFDGENYKYYQIIKRESKK